MCRPLNKCRSGATTPSPPPHHYATAAKDLTANAKDLTAKAKDLVLEEEP